jgi:capsular exopolysaccharide synthesis family protein
MMPNAMGLFRRKTLEATLQPAEVGEALEVPLTREELVVALQPQTQISEQYRRLRNAIQALNPEGAARTVAISSAVQGEGKSIAALNLALAMTEIPNLRTLVVDGDLNRPSLEGYLGLPRRQGIVEVLRGTLSLDRAIRETSVPGLSVLGAGTRPDNPTQLLGSDRVLSVVHALKRRFDYVIIDTPPALVINDASLIGSISDGIVMVVRLGFTPRHLVEQAYNLLESLGGNVLGTCLTGANEEDEGYYRRR